MSFSSSASDFSAFEVPAGPQGGREVKWFDAAVIAHNGKCAERLTSSTPAQEACSCLSPISIHRHIVLCCATKDTYRSGWEGREGRDCPSAVLLSLCPSLTHSPTPIHSLYRILPITSAPPASDCPQHALMQFRFRHCSHGLGPMLLPRRIAKMKPTCLPASGTPGLNNPTGFEQESFTTFTYSRVLHISRNRSSLALASFLGGVVVGYPAKSFERTLLASTSFVSSSKPLFDAVDANALSL